MGDCSSWFLAWLQCSCNGRTALLMFRESATNFCVANDQLTPIHPKPPKHIAQPNLAACPPTPRQLPTSELPTSQRPPRSSRSSHSSWRRRRSHGRHVLLGPNWATSRPSARHRPSEDSNDAVARRACLLTCWDVAGKEHVMFTLFTMALLSEGESNVGELKANMS